MSRASLLPWLVGALFLGGWELAVRWSGMPPYILPAPSRIAASLVGDWAVLRPALAFTVVTTCAALLAAVVGGGALALLFAISPSVERGLFPYAIVLQVTPIVSVAPLIMVWSDSTLITLLICAWLAAFFPILANTTIGLKSADRNLVALFRLYGASRWQTLWHLQVPAALPYFLTGLRISGGASLIGAVVAEFVAGVGGHASGLAFLILESQYRLEVPRMFAGLLLVGLVGIAIYVILSALSRRLLRHWHESESGPDE